MEIHSQYTNGGRASISSNGPMGPCYLRVVAEADTEVLVISGLALERIQRRFPFTAAKLYRNIAGVLSER